MRADERTLIDCPPVDLVRTLGPIRRGSADPTAVADQDGWWWAGGTTDGPATVQIQAVADRDGLTESVRAFAWGPGAAAVLERVPGLVGAEDPAEGFDPEDPTVRRLVQEQRGRRLGRTGRVLDALVPTILGQKVIGQEAERSFRRLVAAHGTDAPGPADLRVAPAPDVLAALPYHAWHPLGVERRRAEIVIRAAREAGRLERAVERPDELRARLRTLRGVGEWTVANVVVTVLGDADAVVVGDHNLPATVAWILAGERTATDERMLELLEPFRGDRARVQRLAKFSGITPPRRGPKLAFREIEHT